MKRITQGMMCAAAAVLLGACDSNDRGTGPTPGDGLFRRYVALGNSITAGVQSEGINDSTQAQSYPVLLAARADADFDFARLQKPGCAPPLLRPLPYGTARVGGGSAISCAGLAGTPPSVNQNLAFPGFKIADALAIPSDPTVRLIYTSIFGQRTSVQLMAAADPSLVSVWLGNNDALAAATGGNAGALTPLASFQASLNAIADAIVNQTDAEEVILLGVLDPQVAPIVQPGLFFWAARQDPQVNALVGKPVNDNCGPGAPGSRNLVSLRIVGDGGVAQISCADDAPYVLSAAEQAAITARVVEFNQAIRGRANAQGWIYVDPNAVLQPLLSDPVRIRRCQGLLDVPAAQVGARLRESCPYPRARDEDFFGTLISFDAVHPAADGHRVIADAIEARIRAEHPDAF